MARSDPHRLHIRKMKEGRGGERKETEYEQDISYALAFPRVTVLLRQHKDEEEEGTSVKLGKCVPSSRTVWQESEMKEINEKETAGLSEKKI